MVGEIRDPETAEIAVQSALTGHLVYTTVHANNAIDVLGRFQHMGVDSYNLVSALNGFWRNGWSAFFARNANRKAVALAAAPASRAAGRSASSWC